MAHTDRYGAGVLDNPLAMCTTCSFPVLESRGWGVLSHKRLMGMCRWMESHFHDWIDYNGVAFSIELLERGRTFRFFR